MLVKLNLSPCSSSDVYLSVDAITDIKVYDDTNTISYTTTACDVYSEHFSSRDALNARFEEVQSWFAPKALSVDTNPAPATSSTPTSTNSMRNCNGYNTKACEHNGKADDCSGCQFESPTKHLVDAFMQLPDALKAQFITEALSHQCITEDEFSMLMGSLPEEDSSTIVEEPDDEIDDELAPTDAPPMLYSINVTIYGATATENLSAAITVDDGEFTHELHELEDTSQASIMNLKSVVAHRLSKAIGEIYTMEWNDKNKHTDTPPTRGGRYA